MKSTKKDIRSKGILVHSNSKKESINYIKVTLEREKKLSFQSPHTDKAYKRNAKSIW